MARLDPSDAPALGRRSANTAATAIASPTMAPAKAVNAGSDLAIDAAQPTAQVRFRATLLCPAGRLGVVISLPLVPSGGLVSVKGQV